MPYNQIFDLRGKIISASYQQIYQYDTSSHYFYNGQGSSVDISSSYAISSSNAQQSNNSTNAVSSTNAISASYAQNTSVALNASYSLNANTASYIAAGNIDGIVTSASYSDNSYTSINTYNILTGSNVIPATTYNVNGMYFTDSPGVKRFNIGSTYIVTWGANELSFTVNGVTVTAGDVGSTYVFNYRNHISYFTGIPNSNVTVKVNTYPAIPLSLTSSYSDIALIADTMPYSSSVQYFDNVDNLLTGSMYFQTDGVDDNMLFIYNGTRWCSSSMA